MDAELKTHLQEMEARLKAHTRLEFGEIEARLRAQAEEMEARLKAHTRLEFEEIEARLRAQAEEMEARLKLHTSIECEKVETKLLREFYKWGRTSDIRTRQALAESATLAERMLNVEDRVTDLERSKLPPQADAA
jgi:hypothetical protein